MPPVKFYAVKRGHKPGVYKSWEDCSRQVMKFKGAIFKSFPTEEEALLFVAETHVFASAPRSGDSKIGSSSVSFREVRRGVKSASKRMAAGGGGAQSSSFLGSGPIWKINAAPDLGPPAAAGAMNSAGNKRKASLRSSEVRLAIYTDGACKGNNSVRSKVAPAGWGVVVSNEVDQDTILELYGPVVLDRASPFYINATVGSNNTAELSAIGEALLWLRDYGQGYPGAVAIRYDSEYAAKSVQGIFNGKKNMELIVYIRGVLREVLNKGRELKWEHIKGHSGDERNDRADHLAGVGSDGHFCHTEGSRYGPHLSEEEVDNGGPSPAKKTRNFVDLT